MTVEKHSLTALARTLLEDARSSTAGRASRTVFGGHERQLRQTLIALAEGQTLDEHDGPGEATLHVLSGRVRLVSGGAQWEGMAGDLLFVPAARHAVVAVTDSAFLLTVSVRV